MLLRRRLRWLRLLTRRSRRCPRLWLLRRRLWRLRLSARRCPRLWLLGRRLWRLRLLLL